MRLSVLLFAVFLAISCTENSIEYRTQINLSGSWQFALDPNDKGIQEQWFLSDLEDTIPLPGTTDLAQKGFPNTDTTTLHLNRLYKYEGAAWYRKKVIIPESFTNKRIELQLERTKPSELWVDEHLVGESKLLQSPHRYNVTEFLDPGEHYITLRIDNSLELTPYRESHIFSDETQTNWNGVIGEMYLEAMPKTYITNLQLNPDIDARTVDINLEIENGLDADTLIAEVHVTREFEGRTANLPIQNYELDVSSSDSLNLQYDLGDETMLWDEYQQPLYELTIVLKGNDFIDSETAPFGMRSFTTNDTQFSINGSTTFLRGKHDAAVFPETGHTPTDVESWKRLFTIAKSYGINHYRFHSYTPPKAAFIAADQTGMYLQPELPFWGGLDSANVMLMLREEGLALLKEFANHPSFVMFSHGNEIWSGHDNVEANIKAFKNYDPRPLYAMGSNNSIGYVWPRDVADFHIAARTPSDGDTTLTHTRLTHAFVDSRDGGILNTKTPSTDFDFSYSVDRLDIPLITHEIGQYQIYPDYEEIDKYEGPVRAWNLEIFRERLSEAGMLDQAKDFQKASGAWSAICYKAEMEAAFRTKGLAGFQLLDLQDFPGQGTALVGILDAFMDIKGVVSTESWRQSCNDIVLLLEFEKYVWLNSESFTAEVKIANYSFDPIEESLFWKLVNKTGEVLESGSISDITFQSGELTNAGTIQLNLSGLKVPEKLTIELNLDGAQISNSYPLWVYPDETSPTETEGLRVEKNLSPDVLSFLNEGGNVLLFPDDGASSNTVGGLFPPNFWNYEMFKGISESNGTPYSPGTLGLLMDPEHPLFNSFPTDFHTNWQWFSIIKDSNPLILNDTADDYLPIVQVIDNLQRNHKLGLIFEFKVGKGKLLICMSRLPDLLEQPEAKQLYTSIVNYMNSNSFKPNYEMSSEQLINLLY